MIDESSDNSEDFTISQPSPESNARISHEDIIADSSSPFKDDYEQIDEICSPEVKKRTIDFTRNESYNKKTKKRQIKRNLLETRPSLNVTISKKNRSLILGKDYRVENTTHKSPFLSNNQTTSAIKPVKIGLQTNLDQIKESCRSLDAPNSLISQQSSTKDFSYKLLDSPKDCKILLNNKRKNLQPDIEVDNSSDIINFEHVSQDISSYKGEDMIIDVNSQSFQIEDNSQEIEKVFVEPIESPTGSSVCEFDLLHLEKTSSKDRNSSGVIKEINCLDKSLATSSRAPKKGSLLEKAYKVISVMKKDAALFSHEISVGLRTCRGKFVSDALIVKSLMTYENDYIIECIPSFNCFESLGETELLQTQPLQSLKMFLFTTELPQGIQKSCRIVIHFPVLVMFDAVEKEIIVFVENRLQIISNVSFICPSRQCSLTMDTKVDNNTRKLYRNLKSRSNKNILDAVVGNLLIFHSTLEVTVLHIYKNRDKVEFLTVDSEEQFSIICLTNSERIMEHIEIDAVYSFVGFCLTKCSNINSELKHILEYYNGKPVFSEYMYTFECVLLNPKINFIKKSESRFRPCSSVNSLLHEKINEKRIKLLVRNIKHIGCKVLVGDNINDNYIYLEIKFYTPGINLPTLPFFLEGISLENDILYFDRYSRIGDVIEDKK